MSTASRPLRFKGSPGRLTAIIAAPQGTAPRAGKLVLAGRDSLPLTIRVQSASPALATLSFRLPNSTRPGSYAGSAEIGETQLPVVIDVEARPRLRFYPPKVVFQGAPGVRLQAELTVLNVGNVDAITEPESTFCIFDNRGMDRAFYQALTEKNLDGSRRVDRLMDELADSHGGLTRAVVLGGAGELAPGAAQQLTIEFQFSHRLRPGQTYRGTWVVAESSLEVEIKATQALAEVAE